MNELEKALFSLIKKELRVIKRSKKNLFAEITVQGKRQGKPTIYKALRSLERRGAYASSATGGTRRTCPPQDS